MNELLKLILGLLFAISFSLFTFLLGRPFKSFECNHNRKMSKKKARGLVIEKEKDSWYGNSERVSVNYQGQIFVWEDDFYELESRAFYDEIEVGDSIVKREGELLLSIYKKDSVINIDLSFECKD